MTENAYLIGGRGGKNEMQNHREAVALHQSVTAELCSSLEPVATSLTSPATSLGSRRASRLDMQIRDSSQAQNDKGGFAFNEIAEQARNDRGVQNDIIFWLARPIRKDAIENEIRYIKRLRLEPYQRERDEPLKKRLLILMAWDKKRYGDREAEILRKLRMTGSACAMIDEIAEQAHNDKVCARNDKGGVQNDKGSASAIAKTHLTIHTNTKDQKMAIGGKYRIAPLNKQEEARLKYELVQEYKRRGPKTLAQMLDVWQIDFKYKQLKINLASVKRWIKQVDEAKQRRIDPLDMLIDTRGKHRKGAIKMSAEMQDIVIKSQLQKEGRPNAKALEYNLKRTFGDEAPNVYAITRLLAAFKEKNKQLVTFANNPGEYKDSCMPAYGNASERADYALKIVELDGTPADVLCADGKRYTILGAIDVFSRRLILTVEERSNSYAVARLLRKVILTLGVPEQVVIDNGKEYTSNHFASICDLLHIYQEIVPPYSGDCKPHIERSFHTVSHEVLPQIPAYIGHNVAAKTAITNRETYEKQQEAKRKFNRSKRAAKNMAAEKAIEYTQDSDLLAIKKDNVGRVLKTALTRDELQGVLDAWIEQVYNARIHTGNGMNLTPIEKWNKTTMPPRMIEDERMLDLLLGQSEIKTVGKKGIRDDNNYYTHAAIAGMGKEEVYILRPDDMGKVIVYDLDMHFICVAIDHEKLGLSREVAREAKNEYRKITKKYAQTVKEATELANKYNTNIIDILAAEPAKSEAVETIRAAVFESAVTRQIKEMNEPINNKEEAGVIDVEATDGERPQFRTIAQKFEWLINHPEDWSIEDTNLIEKHQSLYDETRKRLVA